MGKAENMKPKRETLWRRLVKWANRNDFVSERQNPNPPPAGLTPSVQTKPIPIYDSIEPERFCYVCPQCGCEIDARKVVNRFYFKGHVKEANVG